MTVLNGRLSIQLLPRAPYSACDPLQSQCLGVALERQTGVHSIDSDHRFDFDTWPGVLTYTPVGLPVFYESRSGGEYVVARWSKTVAFAEKVALPDYRKEVPGHGRGLAAGRAIRKALLDPCLDPLAVEEAAVEFVGLCSLPGPARGYESRAIFARVLDRIAAEFDTPLTLSQLASAEGLQEVPFLREFTRLVGMTPHAFIVETRLQAARRLIEGTDSPLALIALDCGFAHQSHMGSAFRDSLGLSPSVYRHLFRERGEVPHRLVRRPRLVLARSVGGSPTLQRAESGSGRLTYSDGFRAPCFCAVCRRALLDATG